jgi:hypothetical protein
MPEFRHRRSGFFIKHALHRQASFNRFKHLGSPSTSVPQAGTADLVCSASLILLVGSMLGMSML